MSDNKFENPDLKNLDIGHLYQSVSTEMPSKETDAAILQYAKSKIAEKSPKPLKKRRWIQWQWPVSVAASVMFVAVLFVHYDMYSNPALLENQLPDSYKVNKPLEVSVASETDLARHRNPDAFESVPEQKSVAVKKLNNENRVEKRALSLNDNTTVQPMSLKNSMEPDNLQVSQTLKQDMAIALPVASLAEVSDEEVFEQVVVTGAIAQNEFPNDLDITYLDSLVKIINDKQLNTEQPPRVPSEKQENSSATLSETTTQISGLTNDSEVTLSKEEAKQALLKYLKRWQERNPDKAIPKRYQVYLKDN